MTEIEMKNIIKTTASQAVKEAMSSVNSESFNIAGCDITCIFKYEENDRNENKGLSLKDWSKKKNHNHSMVYDCLESKEYIIRPHKNKENPAVMEITSKGFIAFNCIEVGVTKELVSPLITVISNSLYIDDKHEMIDEFIALLESCEGFDKDRIYNDDIKSRKITFSRKDLKIMESLNIVVKETISIENTTNEKGA